MGRTGFCIHPWEVVREIPKVGGTKDVLMDRVRELEPTHVVVNVDENLKEDAETLAEFVPNVVVTHPAGAARQPGALPADGGDVRARGRGGGLCERFEEAYARATAAGRPERSVLYLIWRDPWMTVAADTYIAQTFALFDWRAPEGLLSLVAQRATKDNNPLATRRSTWRISSASTRSY